MTCFNTAIATLKLPNHFELFKSCKDILTKKSDKHLKVRMVRVGYWVCAWTWFVYCTHAPKSNNINECESAGSLAISLSFPLFRSTCCCCSSLLLSWLTHMHSAACLHISFRQLGLCTEWCYYAFWRVDALTGWKNTVKQNSWCVKRNTKIHFWRRNAWMGSS